MTFNWFHNIYPLYTTTSYWLTSTKWPLIAAAAAISGLTTCVLAPFPCRPSKFLFDVDAQRPPGGTTSSFIAKHILQPASRHSKPASLKITSSPSFSACNFTEKEPGTTIARTFGCTFCPLTIAAALRRSEKREFVHEPIKT